MLDWKLPWPRSSFARFALLLSLLILGSQVAVWAMYQREVLHPAATRLSSLLNGAYALYQRGAGPLPPGMVTAPPYALPGRVPKADFLQMTAAQWERQAHGAQFRVEPLANGQTRIWIRGQNGEPWLGLPLPSLDLGGWWFLAFRLGLVWLVTLVGVLLVVRQINRPLTRLARKARAIGQGAAPQIEGSVGGPSEVLAVERAMENMANDLHDLYEERQVLLTAISHELRTPLSRLAVALGLSDRQLLAQREEMLNDIDDLNGRIDRVLAVVRSGQEEPFVTGDAAQLFTRLVDLAADEYGLEVRAQYLPEGVSPLRYKPLALERVFRNLLDNARQYGDGRLDLRWHQVETELVWIIEDHGPGVSAERLALLGREVLPPGQARGMGLGLRLSQRILHWHGGRLIFAEAAGGGLQVCICLPILLGEASVLSPKHSLHR
ncbi:ATP-binding protein [Acidithiobacillus sp. IBUN Pt1247-S3]|uniref:ATP-binding protein n=1 Tax=Acidithiobacillus sp. IBUN Pt1247-S3 TaxID=3166642 RepID=UPI0034E48DA5